LLADLDILEDGDESEMETPCVAFSLLNAPLLNSCPPEDPTILSGTLRSILDIFDEYKDAEIVRSTLSLVYFRSS